jgi:hypothetical protein
MPSTEDIIHELEEITAQARAMREAPSQGVRYALQMALEAARLAGASEAQIWIACENPGLCPGVYWSHAERLPDECLVPVDSDLALNHGPYASVVDAYNAAVHNPPGHCIVLLSVGENHGLIEAHKPSTYGVFEPSDCEMPDCAGVVALIQPAAGDGPKGLDIALVSRSVKLPEWANGDDVDELRENLDCWNGERTALVVRLGEDIEIQTDGGEPEDNTFGRDWRWVPDMIRRAYEQGRADADKR